MFTFWYDLMTLGANCSGCGVYTSVSGSAPNRVFNIEYLAVTFAANLPVNFTLRLYEGQQVFDVIYTTTVSGITATIGVEQDNVVFAQYQCPNSPGTLTNGSMLTFTL